MPQLGVDETAHVGTEQGPLEAAYLLDMAAAELSRVVLSGRKLSPADEIRKLLAEVRTKRGPPTHIPCNPTSSSGTGPFCLPFTEAIVPPELYPRIPGCSGFVMRTRYHLRRTVSLCNCANHRRFRFAFFHTPRLTAPQATRRRTGPSRLRSPRRRTPS